MAISTLAIDGSAIRIGRAFKNWSQRELAQAARLSSHRIWQLENNVGRASADEVGRILCAFSGEHQQRVRGQE